MYTPDPWYEVAIGAAIGAIILFAMFLLPILFIKRRYFYETIKLSEENKEKLYSNEFYNFVRDNKLTLNDEQISSLLDYIHENFKTYETLPSIDFKRNMMRGLIPKAYIAMTVVQSFSFISKRNAKLFITLEDTFLRQN